MAPITSTGCQPSAPRRRAGRPRIARLGLDVDAVPAGGGVRPGPAGLGAKARVGLLERAIGGGERGAGVEDEDHGVVRAGAAGRCSSGRGRGR